jgi:hypothetical protein
MIPKTVTPQTAEIQNYELDVFLKPKRKRNKKPIKIKEFVPASERVKSLLFNYIQEIKKGKRKKK